MKKLIHGITACIVISLVFISCPDSGNGGPVIPDNPAPKAIIVFDNTYGICTVLVYDDYRRRDMDRVAEIPAGKTSAEFEWTPSASTPFYFAYRISLKGVSGFAVDFVPEIGKDQKAVRLDAGKKTVIPIPVLNDAVSTEQQVLSPKSYLTILNNSAYSFQLHRGISMIRPDNSPNSGVVNSYERAPYTISPGRSSDFSLLVGTEYKAFPASPERFEAGNFYSYQYNNSVSLYTQIIINLDNMNLPTYSVSFSSNGGSGTLPAAQIVRAASVITLPVGSGLTFGDRIFGGWAVDASGTGTVYSAGTVYTVTKDIILYAKWYPANTTLYTVTFDSAGGNTTASQSMVSGALAIRPSDPYRAGHTFTGWCNDAGGQNLYDFDTPVTKSFTLYAAWDANKYTVTFNANGAEDDEAPAAVTVDYGSVITLPGAGEMSKPDEPFLGWNTEDDGTGTAYASGAQYTVNADVTLFAMWDTAEPPVEPPVEPPTINIVIPEGGALIRINTQAELESIRSHIDDSTYNNGKNAYVLDQDITLSGTWTPIGYVETVDIGGTPTGGIHAFSGNFYGNGHTIRNLVLPGGSIHHIGLFGYIESALIRDLQVELGENVITVTNGTGQYIGIIAGAHRNSVIRNCGVYSQSGIIVNNSTGTYHLDVAGISFGMYRENGNISSIIENCYVSMNMAVTNGNGGTHITASGITSRTNIVRNCYYIGNLTGTGQYAELFSVSFDSEVVEKNYSAGTITNNASSSTYTRTAGIGGHNSMSNCVTLIERIDHVYGTNYARIQTAYASSTLTNNYAYAGMLLNGATVSSSDANSQNGLDKTAAQLKQRSTYEDGLGWDFDDVWEMGPSSYPFPILKWQNGVVKLPPGFSVIGSGETFTVSNVSEFNSALSSIRSSSGNNFTVTVTADLSLSPQDLTLAAYRNKSITLRGNVASRTISLSGQGSLFTVGADVELVLEDIVLAGISNNNAPLVTADGGNIVLNNGAKVTGNRITVIGLTKAGGMAVRNNARLTMNGGEISGNGAAYSENDGAGGLFIYGNSEFVMNGGKISNNTATSNYASTMAGGVFVTANSVFTMNNGEISDNEYNYSWGNTVSAAGLIVGEESLFTMYGGKITRNISTGPTNTWGKEAGGVMITDRGEGGAGGIFYMHGGEISANKSVTHNYSAGGVCISMEVGREGTFIKDGGTIFGSNAEANLRNTTKRADGAAVYACSNEVGGNARYRNTTLGENDNFDSSVSGSAGGWE
jgi:uncharacterized repeat protein (TIGR02543 family)